ncbi:hypothetical protein DXX93_06650 [Thalassotalea euphylliae]|uniref:Uncharacterized protein n=1 Tax=Thalassotalea euphylliae TaxID=1655234 RepID=A0A3E0TPD4_9GAMM|nr:hypothetical protein [Thalassotalea euphylliae]REL26293.1 hypothetical protein DXX93_06650 [Thalassotalea euphylliae]
MINKLTKRTIYIGSFLNVVPLCAMLLVSIGMEFIPFIILILIWANTPFMFGTTQLFGSNNVSVQKFGVTDASWSAQLYLIAFWFLIGWLVACCSTLFSKSKSDAKKASRK